MEEKQLYLAGEVKSVFFENPSNFYKVLLVSVMEKNFPYEKDEIVVTGTFGQLTAETEYRFYGEVVHHPKYGTQFQSLSYEREQPATRNGVIAFLSSDRFPGIGQKTAEKIVDLLGEEALDAILTDADVLKDVPGLTPKKRLMIHDVLKQTQGTERILIDLAGYGFSNNQASAIMQAYKADALTVLQENPYRLIEDVDGMGFRRADQLAEELGFPPDHPNRLKGALISVLQEICLGNGDTYAESDELLDQSLRLLEGSQRFLIEEINLIGALASLVEEGKIIEDGRRFSLPSLYFAEEGIASNLDRLLKKKHQERYPGVNLDKEVAALQKELSIQYDDIQKEAIKEAIQNPFFILTGGPGTGKTTVLKGIVQLYCWLNDLPVNPLEYNGIYPIIMAAPTGRAAKRMNETTGLPSSTIHRLLGLTGQEDNNEEVYTQDLEGKLLIIDEASMVDTWLMNRLLKSIPVGMQVILVGDKDQLPSVGPGQVLFDLLTSEAIPKRELNHIYRQADGSSIIPLAHDIKNGILPGDFTKNQADRSFLPCRPNQIEPLIRQVAERAKAKGFTSRDIQILAPMYKGTAGIDALNGMMQEIMNPNPDNRRREVKHFDVVYRVGDKVLQLVNQPELNVFNGDMGEITSIQYARETEEKVDELSILFDATEVTYKRNDWNKFSLAYCCSIHKSQGSEFTMVILPMVRQYGRMLKRNLLYTAVTRSTSKLILCGETEAFRIAAANTGDLRKTMLVEKLLRNAQGEKLPAALKSPEMESESKEETKKAPANPTRQAPEKRESAPEGKPRDYILTMNAIKFNEVDPLIGMEGIIPSQFMD